MTQLQARALSGGETSISEDAVSQLRGKVRGEMFAPGDAGYDDARKVYNAMIDRRPALVVRAVDVADVIATVNFAREAGILLALRGGGHNGPGLGVCDGGVVLDVKAMKGIRVDPKAKTVRVQAGATWGDVDHATHPFGLAAVSGIISTTGVAGLTLGGGHGHLTRKYGLTIDNLLSADLVLADGSFVTASAEENSDLFWAIRGGGGNFGVVTSFVFRLHPVSTVSFGPTFWPIEQSGDVLRFYREFMAAASEDLNGFFAFLTVPPAPPFPEALHGRKVCGVVWCHSGSPEQAEKDFAPVAAFGPPLMHGVGPVPYPMVQSAFDGLYPKGDQWYWKGDFVKELTDEAIALHVEHGAKMPTPQSTMHLYPIDGAVHRVGRNETAWSYRDVRFSEVIVGVDRDPANNDRIIEWTREYWNALHPHSEAGAYLNFMMEEGQDRIKAAYRDNYDRLVEVKTKYDPGNLFRVNQNIQPKSG